MAFKDGEINQASLGQYDGQVIDGTDATTPSSPYTVFTTIVALEDTVIDTILGSFNSGLDGKTLLAGAVIPGRFTSIKLTSGTVIAYNGV